MNGAWFEIRQLMPLAPGWVAAYVNDDGTILTQPLVCLALCAEGEGGNPHARDNTILPVGPDLWCDGVRSINELGVWHVEHMPSSEELARLGRVRLEEQARQRVSRPKRAK
jgi:hypothetical protein